MKRTPSSVSPCLGGESLYPLDVDGIHPPQLLCVDCNDMDDPYLAAEARGLSAVSGDAEFGLRMRLDLSVLKWRVTTWPHPHLQEARHAPRSSTWYMPSRNVLSSQVLRVHERRARDGEEIDQRTCLPGEP